MAKKPTDKQMFRHFLLTELSASPAVPPVCRHFGECGGCEFQNIPYGRQIEAKRTGFEFVARATVEELRARAASAEDGAAAEYGRRADNLAAALPSLVPALVPSPKPYGYRQRMDYVYAFGRAGLRRANRHRHVVEIRECPLLGEAGFAVFDKARTLAAESGIESYDYLRHQGDLRYFVVRRSRNGQTLLSLVTKTRDHGRGVVDILARMRRAGGITSGHWLLAEGLGDTSFGEPLETIGEPWIVETLNAVDLRIGPNTFFQSNPDVAERAYAAIRDFVPPGGRALDLYSGVGCIALSVAETAGETTAVENAPDNVRLAGINIRENRSAAIRLVEADSSAHLKALTGDPDADKPDILTINPPRPGVEGDGMRHIAGLNPARIAYLSCNPFTLFRNLSEILDRYVVRDAAVYDMFPQTRHFESLVRLERR